MAIAAALKVRRRCGARSTMCSKTPSRLKGFHQRVEAQEHVAGGEQRRQGVGGAPRTAVGRSRIDQPILQDFHAVMLPALHTADHARNRPPRVRPGFTSDFPFGPQEYIDARAEFDQADALAGIENIAGLLVTMMRRAISPAICLNITCRVPRRRRRLPR